MPLAVRILIYSILFFLQSVHLVGLSSFQPVSLIAFVSALPQIEDAFGLGGGWARGTSCWKCVESSGCRSNIHLHKQSDQSSYAW